MNDVTISRHLMEEVAIVYGFSVKDAAATPFSHGRSQTEDYDYTWTHLNLASEAGVHWAREHSRLAPQLVSALCNREEDLGVYPFGTGILVVLEDRRKGFDEDMLELAKLHLWIEPKRVITARWHALAATDRVRFRFQVGAAPATAPGLVIEVLDEIVADVESMTRKTTNQMDYLEDRILDGDMSGLAGQIGTGRRQITRLRRQVLPLRQVVGRIAAEFPAWSTREEADRMELVLSRIERAGGEVVEAQEQARLLHDENSARSAERNGRNLYILSIITAVMLPLNLITGVFGMNVKGLPGVEDPAGFFWVMVGMAATMVAVLAIFRIKRWL
jgi:zinc transporter